MYYRNRDCLPALNGPRSAISRRAALSAIYILLLSSPPPPHTHPRRWCSSRGHRKAVTSRRRFWKKSRERGETEIETGEPRRKSRNRFMRTAIKLTADRAVLFTPLIPPRVGENSRVCALCRAPRATWLDILLSFGRRRKTRNGKGEVRDPPTYSAARGFPFESGINITSSLNRPAFRRRRVANQFPYRRPQLYRRGQYGALANLIEGGKKKPVARRYGIVLTRRREDFRKVPPVYESR